jgi:protein-S-isoprenylcysteine O-methyltransferase Ste14
VLTLLTVQILAGIGLVLAVLGVIVARSDRPRRDRFAPVVARRAPARWTEVAWIAGALVVTLWPLGVFVAPEYAYHWPPFPDFPGSWAVQVFGVALVGSAGWLFGSSARALGPHMTPSIQVREGHRLVQEGPYRLVRHPVYTAIMTLAIGQALFFLSFPVALFAVLLVGLANYRARLEEALLRSPEAFGATYDAYVARTGRFLPRLRSNR